MRLLAFILSLLTLTCFGQSIQRQRWTTNTAPDSVVIAGVNTTVTTNVLAGGRVTFTIDSAGGPGGSQTNLALVVGGTNAYVSSVTNLGVTTFTVDGPALRTQWSVGDITNAGTAAYSNAAAFDLSGTALNATNSLYGTLSGQIVGSTNTTTLTTQLGLGTAAYSNTAAFLLKAGDTATGPLLSSSASITTPASTELATAGWVRSLFNSGSFFYTTTNVFANATNVGSDQFVYEFSTNIPLPAVRSWTTTAGDFLTNNGYIGSVLVTNPLQQLSGQISVSAYLGFTGGASTPTLTLHPEIYYSYDRTNWLGDYSAGNQNIVHNSTNLYQWVIDFPAQTSTNATGFWIQRRFKVGAVTGTGTRTLWVMIGTNAISGTADASHISVNLPNGTINSTKSIYVADISTNQLPYTGITNSPWVNPTNAKTTGAILYAPSTTDAAWISQSVISANAGARVRVPAVQGGALTMTPVSQFGIRRMIYIGAIGSTSLSGVGDALTVGGLAGFAIASTATANPSVEYFTPAVTANTNGVTMGQQYPCSKSGSYNFVVQVTNAASWRMWVAVTTASGAALANDETNTVRTGFGFLGSTTNWANWRLMTDDGNATHWTMTDTGVALTTPVTNFTFIVNGNSSVMTSVVGLLNGIPVATNTSNLPSFVGRPEVGIATLDNAAAGFRFYEFSAELDR